MLYKFIQGITGKLGVGVADLGLSRPSSVPLSPLEGGGVMVRRSLGPTAPGYIVTNQRVVPVSWLGDTGIAPYSPTELGRLASQGK